MKSHFTAAPAAPRVGPRMDVRYMTRSQLFESATRISMAALVVCVTGFLTAYLVDTAPAWNADALADMLALASTMFGGLGALTSGYLVVRGLARSRAYSPVSVWQADLEREARLRRSRIRCGIELGESGIASIRRGGRDLVLQLEAYVHQSTGVPGRDPGTGWHYRAEMRIRSGQVREPAPSAPLEIAEGALDVGSRRLEGVIPAPLDFRGLVRFEVETADADILVIEGDGVKVRLHDEGRYLEIFEP